MLLRYYGNALLTVEQGNTKLLIDPFFSRNPKLYRPTAELFDDVTAVLITHGHFDHIYDLPKLLARRPGLEVFCTRQTKKNLERIGCHGGQYHIIGLDDAFEIGPFRVRSIRSTHISFDFYYIAKNAISPSFYLSLTTVFKSLHQFSTTPLGDECVEFLIEADGETMLVSASLGADESINHPQDVDMFVMPYNGRWYLNEHMFKHVLQIRPKKIMMSHFDAAFPPLCLDAKPERFVRFMKERQPQTEVIIPEYTKSYAVRDVPFTSQLEKAQ